MDDPYKRSPELEAIARRWITARSSSAPDVIGNLFSTSDALSYIGSADGEVWNAQGLHDAFIDYMDEVPALNTTLTELHGWERGETGYVYLVANVHTASTGATATFRNTLMFSMESGMWKLVHVHVSNPVPNAVSMGHNISAVDDLLAAARAAKPDLEHRGLASVMFTDIARSTAIAASVGDRSWTALVQDHVASVRTIIETHGGRLIKSLGDGTLSVFGAARASMLAAIDIQNLLAAATDEPVLQVRIGIHTGDVVEDQDDFYGTVVNKAARIAALAAPDEIRISESTRAMVGRGSFTFADPVSRQLKGLDGDHLIYLLEWHNAVTN